MPYHAAPGARRRAHHRGRGPLAADGGEQVELAPTPTHPRFVQRRRSPERRKSRRCDDPPRFEIEAASAPAAHAGLEPAASRRLPAPRASDSSRRASWPTAATRARPGRPPAARGGRRPGARAGARARVCRGSPACGRTWAGACSRCPVAGRSSGRTASTTATSSGSATHGRRPAGSSTRCCSAACCSGCTTTGPRPERSTSSTSCVFGGGRWSLALACRSAARRIDPPPARARAGLAGRRRRRDRGRWRASSTATPSTG